MHNCPFSDHRAIYTDGSKTENRVAAAATSDGLSAQVRLPGNASIYSQLNYRL